MNKGRISFKEEALRSYSRGEWRKAIEYFRKHCIRNPGDLRTRLKMAILLERLNRKNEAVQAYKKLAEAYARDGFLLQAISINKMILRIDPSSKDVNARLAQLFTEKIRGTKSVRPIHYIPLFSDLKEQELQSMLGHLQVNTFLKGSSICREGEEGDSLFIICRGEVAISKQMQGKKEVWIRNLRKGDFFGEFGFFTDQKRHASVKAVTESEILQISRSRLETMVNTYPRVKEVLQKFLRERVLDLFLAFSPLFSSLTSAEREEVFKRFRLVKVPEKTLLFKEGDSPHSLYMIKNGEVEIFTHNRQGRRLCLGMLKSGNLFGEISLLFNKPRMAFAETILPSELLELTRDGFEACLLHLPNLRPTLEELSFKRLSRTKEILSQNEIEKAREMMV
jgi:cAMP-dependent protein kinase regulator